MPSAEKLIAIANAKPSPPEHHSTSANMMKEECIERDIDTKTRARMTKKALDGLRQLVSECYDGQRAYMANQRFDAASHQVKPALSSLI